MVKELTIKDIETIVHRDENRVMEAKETTGELVKGMQSGCAFLNTDGGWLFFGIHPTKLTIRGQDVADRTRQEIAWEMRKFAPVIDLAAQYIPVPRRLPLRCSRAARGRDGAEVFPTSMNFARQLVCPSPSLTSCRTSCV